MVGETVEGVARYPINIRYPQDYRNSPQALKQMPILTPMKQQITLGDVADINVVSGPTMLKTENARPASWIYVDARGRDMVSVVNDIKTAISEKVKLRPGTSVAFSGQFELLEHANKKLKLMVPMTVMIIFILLYLAFRRVDEALLILMSLPFAPGWRNMVPVLAGLPYVSGDRNRVYRHGRGGSRVWRGHADVSASCH